MGDIYLVKMYIVRVAPYHQWCTCTKAGRVVIRTSILSLQFHPDPM